MLMTSLARDADALGSIKVEVEVLVQLNWVLAYIAKPLPITCTIKLGF